MKSEQPNLKQSDVHETKQKFLRCSGGNQAVNACLRQKCQKAAFLCINKQCTCKQPHKQCFIWLPIQCIFTFLNSKIQSLKKIGQRIQQQIKQIIDQLSKFEQLIANNLDNSPNYSGFTEIENQLLKALRIEQNIQISGKDIKQFQKTLQKQEKNKYQLIQKKIVKNLQTFQKQIQSFKISIVNNLFEQNVLQFKESQIIKENEDKQKMINFFDIKIKNTQLIFRATKQSFKIAKFREKCNGISDTLTIVETQDGKIFGGYTPCAWTLKDGNGIDKELKSFIFQLNNNDKFKLKATKTDEAIGNNQTLGPIFGGKSDGEADFYIADSADSNKNSYTNIGTNYQNANYINGDSNSKIKFSGGSKFTLKEYQVWKILFNPQK